MGGGKRKTRRGIEVSEVNHARDTHAAPLVADGGGKYRVDVVHPQVGAGRVVVEGGELDDWTLARVNPLAADAAAFPFAAFFFIVVVVTAAAIVHSRLLNEEILRR